MIEVQSFYEKYPYPAGYDILKTPKGNICYKSGVAPENIQGDILVIGCGTCEANIIALMNPDAEVWGIDLSAASLDIARAQAVKFSIDNVIYDRMNFLDFDDIYDEEFDYVIATGVLHHTNEPLRFINNTHACLKKDGVFSGMVYNEKGRDGIRKANNEFRSLGFTTDDVLRNALQTPGSKVSSWVRKHSRADVEIADTWLNPYFDEYTPETFGRLFEQSLFKESVFALKLKMAEFEDNTKILFNIKK